MSKLIRRLGYVAAFTVALGLFWRWVGQTAWASTVDIESAGPQWSSPIEPLKFITGAVLVAVPGMLLLRSLWARLVRLVVGEEYRRVHT